MPDVTSPPPVPASETIDALETAAREVLETMFFTDVNGAAGPGCAPPAVSAAVRFHGQPSGILSVGVTAESALRMTADFLGEEFPERIAAEAVSSVIGELANMICGAVLSRVESGETFQLGTPEPLPPGSPFSQAPACRALDLGDGSIHLLLEWYAP